MKVRITCRKSQKDKAQQLAHSIEELAIDPLSWGAPIAFQGAKAEVKVSTLISPKQFEITVLSEVYELNLDLYRCSRTIDRDYCLWGNDGVAKHNLIGNLKSLFEAFTKPKQYYDFTYLETLDEKVIALDKLGERILEGDFIVYGHALGRSAVLKIGLVMAPPRLSPKQHSNGIIEYRVTVRGWEQDYSSRDPHVAPKNSCLMFPDRTLVLPHEKVPQNIKDAYHHEGLLTGNIGSLHIIPTGV